MKEWRNANYIQDLSEKIMIVSTKGADCTVIYFSGIWAISVKDICVKIFQGFIFLDFDHP